MWNMANTTTKKANAAKKQRPKQFWIKKKKKMDVSLQTPKGFVDKTAAETCTKETT